MDRIYSQGWKPHTRDLRFIFHNGTQTCQMLIMVHFFCCIKSVIVVEAVFSTVAKMWQSIGRLFRPSFTLV